MLAQAFILAFNHLLRNEPWAQEKLKPFSGRTARLVSPPLTVVFVVSAEGGISEAAVAEADVELRLPSHASFLIIARSPSALSQAKISGSAEFADALAFVARNLRWDYEEDLSRVVGDIAAHRIAAGLKRLRAWNRQAAQGAAENLVEYLRDERGDIVSRGALSGFNNAVDALRDDLSRLEKRVHRLGAGNRSQTLQGARRPGRFN